MPVEAFLLVLCAALVHAAWNALIKLEADRLALIRLMCATQVVLSLALIPFVALPAGPSWPYLGASALLGIVYVRVLNRAYQAGDLSFVYPLARGFAEYALSLPVDDKIRGRETKRLFRLLARRHLPAEIVDRPKHGFAPPLSRLLRGVLAAPVEATLTAANSPLATWFRGDEIARLWSEHRSGARDHRKKLWTLFTLAEACAAAG